MARKTITFTFCGSPVIPNRGLTTDGKTKTGADWVRMSLGVKAGTSTEFAGLYGMVRDTVRTMSTDNKPIEFAWDDRNDPDVVEHVAGYRKFRTNIGSEETLSFVTEYDFIRYLQEALSDYEGDIVVRGTLDLRYDNKGKLRQDYNISSVWAANEKDVPGLTARANLYFSGKSLDKSVVNDTHRMYLDSYVMQYVNKDEGTMFFPFPVVLLADSSDETAKKKLAYNLTCIEHNKSTMQHMLFDLQVVDGADEIPFDESQLTPMQKQQIELGMKKLDDFRPSGSIRGQRVKEIRIIAPYCYGEFADGMVDSGIKNSEFEEMIYSPAADVPSEMLDKELTMPQTKVPDPIEDDELF